MRSFTKNYSDNWEELRRKVLGLGDSSVRKTHYPSLRLVELEHLRSKLQRSEAYLTEAQRLSHTGSFGWVVQSGENTWSDETFRIFEYGRAVKPSLELVLQRTHPDDRALVRQTLDRASNDGTNFDYEHRLLMPDGRVKHLHVVADVLHDSSGAIEFVGAVMDITAAKRQNDRLQLLLNLTNRITSNLDFRELLRAISANIREVIQADVVAISLPDAASGKLRVFAVDFPHARGSPGEEQLVTPTRAAKEALDTVKPVVLEWQEDHDLSPEAYDRAAAEGLKARCVIPLVNQCRALGVLSINRTTETSFTPEDVEFLSQASGQIAIAIENALAYREISELRDKLAQEKLYLEEEIRAEMGFEHIIGNSAALKHVLELVETVAPMDSTVLLLGETGTGKELIARGIHDHSRRQQRSFVKLNCAAIPTGLLESELFGHEKGAFTGAISQKVGRLELADHGTLFLDEVGDIPIEIRPKLLRALQEREFERLGSTHTRKVNVRLRAATNRDLEKMIAAREFRNDLYYRLNVFPIRIPPLRDRKEDIPLLLSYFVQKFAKQMQKKIEAISPAVMKGLTAWEWPGNIRELENFLERAVILTRGKSLDAPLAELRKLNTDEAVRAAAQPGQEDIARIVKETIAALDGKKGSDDDRAKKQREEIVRALTESKGRVGGADGAAARMGINRTTLISRMKKFGIDPNHYA